MNEPFVTIIVPVYNAEKTIKKCIESLIGIDYPGYDVFIVDDGSSDKTKDILTQYYKDKIRIIESKHFGPSKSRNLAVLEAKGDFIAFTDSDCIVDRNWLKELMAGFIDEKVVAVGGSQYSPDDETFFGRNVQTFFDLTGFLGGYIKSKNKEEIIKVPHNPSCNVMYRKNVFLDVGGFDEELWPCEDVDLDFRLKKKGFIFMYNPKAIIYHYRPQTLGTLTKMMYRYGVMQGILTKRYGFFRKIQFIPIFLILFVILVLINHYWILFLLIPYIFITIKLRNFAKSNFVAFLAIVSFFYWILGFLGGLITFKK